MSTEEEDDRCNEPPRVGAACPASGADPLWCETRGWSSQSQERVGARRRLSWHCQGAASYSRPDGSLCRVGLFQQKLAFLAVLHSTGRSYGVDLPCRCVSGRQFTVSAGRLAREG